MSKVLVCGADGQLGREIKKIRNRYSQICSFTDIKELDLSDTAAISSFLSAHPTDYIINCAAYTDVDKAESEKELAMQLNRDVVANLVESIKEHPATRIIHISTDYVYKDDKNRPLMEDDATEPSSVYGITKLEGDKQLMNHPRALVIRTSWLFSVFGKNFVKSMINRMDQRGDLKVFSTRWEHPLTLKILPAQSCKSFQMWILENRNLLRASITIPMKGFAAGMTWPLPYAA